MGNFIAPLVPPQQVPHDDGPVRVTVTDRKAMDYQLEAAVSMVKARALSDRTKPKGILVTRHSIDSFTVALSEAVPFGTTLEHRAW